MLLTTIFTTILIKLSFMLFSTTYSGHADLNNLAATTRFLSIPVWKTKK